MKFFIKFSLIISVILFIGGCKSIKTPVVITPTTSALSEQKIYKVPAEQQKESYSVEDFKLLHSEYLKLNNMELLTSPENDKTEMSKESRLKYYTIDDITPKNIKEEIGCQIFKVNYTCETYIVNKSKVYAIGLGFGGFGVVNIESCDLDYDGHKDLIYTFSWGSGLHRSHIGIFNLAKEKEEWLDFQQMNEDIVLEKVSDTNFKVYIAKVSSENLDFIHLELSKQEQVAVVKNVDGKIEIIKYKFAIYLVKGLSSFEAIKMNINELPLETEPIITEDDISLFYWKSNIFKTVESGLYDKLRKVTALSGTPFVLTANGEKVYLGTLWTALSSAVAPSETPVLFLESGVSAIDELNKNGYNVTPKENEHYFEILAPSNGNDCRSDIRIFNALKTSGIIKE